MGYEFAPGKIAQMAMSIEENGAMFYDELSRLAGSDDLKGILIALSKAERKHRDKFAEIAEANRDAESAEYSVDISMIMQKHIDELKARAFMIKSRPQVIEDALNMAISIEKTAIDIYSQMYESFIEKFRGVLSIIINEEKKHLEVLYGIKEKLKLQY